MDKRRCALIAAIVIGLTSAGQAGAAANGNACSAWIGRTAAPMDFEIAPFDRSGIPPWPSRWSEDSQFTHSLVRRPVQGYD